MHLSPITCNETTFNPAWFTKKAFYCLNNLFCIHFHVYIDMHVFKDNNMVNIQIINLRYYCIQAYFRPSLLNSPSIVVFKEKYYNTCTLEFAQCSIFPLTTRTKETKIKLDDYFPVCSWKFSLLKIVTGSIL